MTEQLFDEWKSVKEQLEALINGLDGEPANLDEVRDGVVKLAKVVIMVDKALEVLAEDYAYTVKMLKEKEGK
jgi:hypothetical protein